ncbi:MAG: Gfo/Idh/MocA family oxidoreductase [Lentisphaerae bacterium]|nr:Gfo/Idh/MocA family oxidoreductase [Lentisphaerota bacterium]
MNRKVKVGLWGVGRAAIGNHMEEIKVNSDRVEVAALCDIDAVQAEEYGKKLNVPYYTDPNKFLADKNMDVVAVATYSADHIKHARQALEAGFYTIIEKPIANSRADAEELVELDKKYPGKLFPRHNRRFEAAFNHVKEIIATGILGKLHTIKLCRNQFSRRDDWQTLLANQGGQLNNWGPHILDHALQFLNYEVESVWSELKLIAAQGDAEDCVKVILKGKHGLTVDVEIFGGDAMPSNTYEVYGDRGALFCTPDEQDIKLRYIDPDYELKPYPVNTGRPNGFIFADTRSLPWIRKTIMTRPANGMDIPKFYSAIADSVLDNVPFPVKLSEALAVVEISDIVKSQSPFYNKELAK